jgi:hypothetical protein
MPRVFFLVGLGIGLGAEFFGLGMGLGFEIRRGVVFVVSSPHHPALPAPPLPVPRVLGLGFFGLGMGLGFFGLGLGVGFETEARAKILLHRYCQSRSGRG